MDWLLWNKFLIKYSKLFWNNEPKDEIAWTYPQLIWLYTESHSQIFTDRFWKSYYDKLLKNANAKKSLLHTIFKF
jgi:hypothetical protein